MFTGPNGISCLFPAPLQHAALAGFLAPTTCSNNEGGAGGEGGSGGSGGGDGGSENSGGGEGGGSGNGGGAGHVEQGLQAALAAERKKRQEFERQLAEIRQQQEEADRKKAEEQGEFKRLYEEAEAKRQAQQAELDQLRQAQQAAAEAQGKRSKERIEALPEEARKLIPEGLSGAALASHLDAIEQTFADPQRPAGAQPRGSRGGGDSIPAACHAAAKKAGLAKATPTFFERWKSRTRAGRAWNAAQNA